MVWSKCRRVKSACLVRVTTRMWWERIGSCSMQSANESSTGGYVTPPAAQQQQYWIERDGKASARATEALRAPPL